SLAGAVSGRDRVGIRRAGMPVAEYRSAHRWLTLLPIALSRVGHRSRARHLDGAAALLAAISRSASRSLSLLRAARRASCRSSVPHRAVGIAVCVAGSVTTRRMDLPLRSASARHAVSGVVPRAGQACGTSELAPDVSPSSNG